MASPTTYALSYDFTAFQTASPTTPLPADKLEIEFNNLQQTTDEIITNLDLIQRADGALHNAIVTYDSLDANMKAQLSATDAAATIAACVAAQGAAETAQGLAETAQGAAETAQGLAETAASAAEVAKIEWQGSWAAGTYNQHDAVYHNGSSWIATATTTTEEPSGSATDWDYLTLGDAISSAMEPVVIATTLADARTAMGLKTAAVLDSVDEDTMTSNSDTKLPTQQSVKAYVDNLVGPVFFVYYNGSQTVTSNVDTKVTLTTEVFDTDSLFDNSTNYRFTPTKAGYYRFEFGAYGKGSTDTSFVVAKLFKNGADLGATYGNGVGGSYMYSAAAAYTDAASRGSILIYMNGTSDYVELYGRVFGAGTCTVNSAFLSGSFVRSA